MSDRDLDRDPDREAVSPELDAMVGDLIGAFLDSLAEGEDPGVVACLEDAASNRCEMAFSEDGAEACLTGARQFIERHAKGVPGDGVGPVVRYALAYAGCIELEDGFQDAVITGFYERGQGSAYSAYVLYDGAGTGDGFQWADPQPAGVEEPLI